MNQLKAYRAFGSPDVSLLDVYICESGFMRGNRFPSGPVRDAIVAKLPELKKSGFGYQLLPFEHDKNGDIDVGLRTYNIPTRYGSPSTNIRLLSVARAEPVDGFAGLMQRLHQCYEREVTRIPTKGKGFVAIVFCRECRQLGLTPMKEADRCFHCGKDLWIQ